MTDNSKQIVSAQVVLKPASGKDAPAATEITAENAARLLPSAEDLQRARNYFSGLGFDVQAAYGNSFAVTGASALFEKVFKTKLAATKKGGVKSAAKDGAQSLELPLASLPQELKKIVSAVTFSAPPDFGPTDF